MLQAFTAPRGREATAWASCFVTLLSVPMGWWATAEKRTVHREAHAEHTVKKDLVTVCNLSGPEAEAWRSPLSPAEGGGWRAGEEAGGRRTGAITVSPQTALLVNSSISRGPYKPGRCRRRVCGFQLFLRWDPAQQAARRP